jgi:hypothetical protein
MSICQSCGGVIGRDCFNPAECMEITRAQAECYQSQGDVQGELAHLRERVKELEAKAAIVDWIEANVDAIDFGHEYLFRTAGTEYPRECTNANLVVCVRAIMKQKGLL